MFIEERKFDYWMNRLVAHFETVNRKIDKLSNTENKINDEVLLDNQDLCLLLKVSKRTLQRFRSSGKLPYKRIGKKTYYLESDVHKFIQNGFSKT
ncbi:MAG TPA: DNA-binding protein [Bacteroidales bacterium]|nr:DNA-binding protein [Bacteroidales bacterium]